MWGAYLTGMTIKLLVLPSPKNLVLYSSTGQDELWIQGTSQPATYRCKQESASRYTLFRNTELAWNKATEGVGYYIYTRQFIVMATENHSKQNNQSYFSPFYTNTLSPSSQDHSKRMTDSYYLSTHTPTHQISCGEVFLIWHNIKDNILVLLWLNKIWIETGSLIHAKLMGEDLFCIASYL